MRLLIVEDEKKTAAYLKKGLSENGFVVDISTDGEDGEFRVLNYDYDLIILDVTLPGKDGWTVMSGIRSKGKTTPVLFLTARDSIGDKVKGLQLGADDYLIKPFSFAELLARIQSILRRAPSRQPDTLKIVDLEIDFIHHKVFRDGKRLDLSAKEFVLLSFLARRKGEVLSRTLIAEQVWDMNFDSDTNVVDVAIRRLRSKMDDSFSCKLIHTVRGMGYVLEERKELV